MFHWKWWVGLLIPASLWFLYRPMFWPAAAVVLVAGARAFFLARGRRQGPGLLERVARVLELDRADGDRLVVAVDSRAVELSQDGLAGQLRREAPLLTVAALVGRRVPFCFVIRSQDAPGGWVNLVENTPLSGVRFEYVLGAGPSPEGLETASNHPGLLSDLLGGALQIEGLPEGSSLTFTCATFDGGRLRTWWSWDREPPEAVLRLTFLRTLLMADNLAAALGRVDFKQPL